ncbi:DNA primase [Nemorincola caseinilytica]|uniref:DNA primase n=2 Tax=Nemorincola caseinilytica TaxID=2054315 RepID=A0ABP8NNJ6_9BACT
MDRADIIDVLGQFIRLKKRGANYIANCPFHNEKTPSFNVSPAKGIFKCFGCGKAGDVVTFVQEHEKLTYPEAIRWIADYYKIQLEESERTPEQQQQQMASEALRILNEYAAGYFHDTLLNTEEGQLVGLSYFKQRGFRKDIIDRFKLGFNPDRGDVFYRDALAHGYSAEVLERAGLAKNRNGIYHDVYRGRVIFPIHGMTGRILGFGARILRTTDKAPKYINTPENELYVKSRVLYGMYQSRQAIGKLDECLLVEGYTDVISLHQGGVENVVASSGTSLTEDQLRLIGQLTKNLTILYDGDPAGIKAALRGLDMALSQSFNVQLVLLPEGEDPDSFVQKSGAARFHEYIKSHKQDVISFRLQVGMTDAGDDPVKRSKLVNEIAESISRINKAEDFALQSHYIKLAARRLDVDEAGLINLINKYIRDRIETEQRHARRAEGLPQTPAAMPDPAILPTEQETQGQPAPPSSDEEQEWQLLRVLIEYGAMPYEGHASVIELMEERVETPLLMNPTVRQLFEEHMAHYKRTGQAYDVQYYLRYPDEAVRTRMASLLHSTPDISQNWSEKYGMEVIPVQIVGVNDVDSTLCYFELKKILHMQTELIEKLPHEKDPLKQMAMQQLFLKLRATERDILKRHETVVFKALKYR